jgi:ADP-heptose:LPS heptosyltransferase
MKILAISLLRVGDLIMHEIVLSSLRKKFPEADLHLLVNDVSARYARTTSTVSKVHIFDRTQLQNGLVEESRPLMGSFRKLRQLTQNLNSMNYDLVINLSHTHLSARLMDLIQAPQKIGMAFENGKRTAIDQPWLQYMNENFSQNLKSPFHYVDMLAQVCEVPHGISISPAQGTGELICLQPLTSDPKKNWPLKNYFELALLLKESFPQNKVVVLAAPDEAAILRPHFDQAPGVEVRVLPWVELRETLKDATLLITGDTSVQHLGAQVGVRTLSLFLAGSTPERTSSYSTLATVLQPRAPRAEELSVNDVFKTAQLQLQNGGNWEDLDLKSHLYHVTCRPSGFHFLKKIGKGTEMFNVRRALEQTVWQIYLDKGHLDPVGPFGSSTYVFMQEFAQELKNHDVRTWLKSRSMSSVAHFLFLEELEKDFRQKSVEAISPDSPEIGADFLELGDRTRSHLIRRTDGQDYFFNLEQELGKGRTDFSSVQKIRRAFYEAKFLVQIESQFLKTLLQEITEREISYVSGSGTLSHASFATT